MTTSCLHVFNRSCKSNQLDRKGWKNGIFYLENKKNVLTGKLIHVSLILIKNNLILKYLYTWSDFVNVTKKLIFIKRIIYSELSICSYSSENRLCSSATDSEIFEVAKNWLRFASDRDGGVRKEKKKKENEMTDQQSVGNQTQHWANISI